jgi:hypothetical protein
MKQTDLKYAMIVYKWVYVIMSSKLKKRSQTLIKGDIINWHTYQEEIVISVTNHSTARKWPWHALSALYLSRSSCGGDI